MTFCSDWVFDDRRDGASQVLEICYRTAGLADDGWYIAVRKIRAGPASFWRRNVAVKNKLKLQFGWSGDFWFGGSLARRSLRLRVCMMLDSAGSITTETTAQRPGFGFICFTIEPRRISSHSSSCIVHILHGLGISQTRCWQPRLPTMGFPCTVIRALRQSRCLLDRPLLGHCSAR
ncbi:hypothetical protein N658DRAFT_341052 [Parathielavia hyrcaniae]|uniref:Uncharacterized protein n=1 Tax=Parathielavia hyrcaniae TaxID=113614 RepID=A0AAN6T2N1_9PEZI|nr:hypothetical protein N658DRAFT_341052 [Parathielavia hyrcaniae]